MIEIIKKNKNTMMFVPYPLVKSKFSDKSILISREKSSIIAY